MMSSAESGAKDTGARNLSWTETYVDNSSYIAKPTNKNNKKDAPLLKSSSLA